MEYNNCDISMLNEIYQNASMGVKGSQLLLEKSQDSRFAEELHDFLGKYESIKQEAGDQLYELGQKPREPGAMENASLWMGVQLNTLLDKTPSHMAEMLIQGGTMGVIKGEKTTNSNEDAGDGTRKLSHKLTKLQQEHIDAMKRYLS